MSFLSVISGPLIGAVIGYFTNYIAVKMLFHPYHPVKVAGRVLPFTPGIIPKRQKALAGAIGNAVSDVLVTDEDFKEVLCSDSMTKAVSDGIAGQLEKLLETDVPLKTVLLEIAEEETCGEQKELLVQAVTDRILKGAEKLDLGSVIVSEGTEAVKQSIQGSMLAMFVNDQMIASIADPMGARINTWIQQEGGEKIRPLIEEELTSLEEKPVGELLETVHPNREKLTELCRKLYQSFIQSMAGDLAGKFDMKGIVTRKISEMSVEDLEKLVLSVMKKELDTIVNLGALIGFVIGLLNIWL